MPGQRLNTMAGTRTVRVAVFTAAACPEHPKGFRSLTFASHVPTLDHCAFTPFTAGTSANTMSR
jgi:hypothetical protein